MRALRASGSQSRSLQSPNMYAACQYKYKTAWFRPEILFSRFARPILPCRSTLLLRLPRRPRARSGIPRLIIFCAESRQKCPYALALHFYAVNFFPCTHPSSCCPRPTFFQAARTRRTRRPMLHDRSQSSSPYVFASSVRLTMLKSQEMIPFGTAAHHFLSQLPI